MRVILSYVVLLTMCVLTLGLMADVTAVPAVAAVVASQSILDWVRSNWAAIATGLWFVCEALAVIPSVKSNSIFTLIYNLLRPKPKA